MSISDPSCNVVIVGAGPVGLLLGYLLRKNGVSVQILEKHGARSAQSKASSMNAYSLAILHAAGIVSPFLSAGKPVRDLLLYWKNRRLMRVNYRRLPSRYNYILGLSQPETEALLEQSFVAAGGVIRRGTELLGFDQGAHGVTVHHAGGAPLACDYLVGCDGARSTVRQLLGLEFSGADMGVKFFMFDGKIRWHGDLGKVHYFVRDHSLFLIIPQANGNHRVIIKSEGEHVWPAGAGDLPFYQRMVELYGPEGVRVDAVYWESESRFYNRQSSRYHAGRVYLAGDACHLFSPVGGLGMNTGFQDALNLAWKMAGVLKGRYRDTILQSYTDERRAISQQLIASTDLTTRLILRLERDEHGPLQGWLPKMVNRGKIARDYPLNFSGLAQRYQPGPLVPGKGPLVGRLIPFFDIDDGGPLRCSYDLIDCAGYVLLSAAPWPAALQARLRRFGFVRALALARGAIGAVAARQLFGDGGDAVLMRPDGVVCLQGPAAAPAAFIAHLEQLALTGAPGG
jgi:2-polyprenyl-6-methoxyphenol hydroxylase-like FAD-dependent oxidoreductase